MSIFDSIPEQEERLEHIVKGEQRQNIADWIAVKSGQYTLEKWETERERIKSEFEIMYGYDGSTSATPLSDVAMPAPIWMCPFVDRAPDGKSLILKNKIIQRSWNFIHTADGLWHACGEIVLYKYDEESLPFFIDATRVIVISSPKIIPYLNQNHIPYEKWGVDY